MFFFFTFHQISFAEKFDNDLQNIYADHYCCDGQTNVISYHVQLGLVAQLHNHADETRRNALT